MMRKKSTSAYMNVQQLYAASMDLLQRYFPEVIVLSLLPTLTAQLGALLIPRYFETGVILYLLGVLWAGLNAPVLAYYSVKVARGQAVSIRSAYREGLRYFWRYLGYSLIAGVLVTIGFLLLIVPGFILLRRYLFGSLYIVDKDLSIGEALQRSAAESKPVASYIWSALGIMFIISAVVIIFSLIFASVPWLAALSSTALYVTALFVLPLRYVEIADNAATTGPVSLNS